MYPSLPHDHGEPFEKEIGQLPPLSSFTTLSEIFKQLGDESRLRIFWLLCHCEECVINISSMMDMTSPAVSHHLKMLKAGGLITSTRRGKEVYYKAADTDKTRLLHSMIESMMEIACPWKADKYSFFALSHTVLLSSQFVIDCGKFPDMICDAKMTHIWIFPYVSELIHVASFHFILRLRLNPITVNVNIACDWWEFPCIIK